MAYCCGEANLLKIYLSYLTLLTVPFIRKKKKKKEAAERKFLAKGRMYRAALDTQSSAGGLSVKKIENKKKCNVGSLLLGVFR